MFFVILFVNNYKQFVMRFRFHVHMYILMRPIFGHTIKIPIVILQPEISPQFS